MTERRFARGDRVVVRGADEIMATLDADGTLDGLPFMPEMVPACGRSFTVDSRASKLCDTISYGPQSRRMAEAVLLAEERCDGSGHDGCQSSCLVYWKEAWLRPAGEQAPATFDGAGTEAAGSAALLERVTRAARLGTEDHDSAVRYRCQATDMVAATTPLSASDPRVYIEELTSGNVSFRRFARVMARASVIQPLHSLGKLNEFPYAGETDRTPPPPPPLDLQPGEWVRVKSIAEIRKTLNRQGRNRGLWFDREMAALSGGVFQVRARIVRIVDERNGAMIEFGSDCITLENNWCAGDHSTGRWLCPRKIYGFWRESWLERVAQPGRH